MRFFGKNELDTDTPWLGSGDKVHDAGGEERSDPAISHEAFIANHPSVTIIGEASKMKGDLDIKGSLIIQFCFEFLAS